MKTENRVNFFTLIADVHAFYRQSFSEFSGSIWWEAMKPYEFEAVSGALSRHCINPDVGQFMPKPADVVRMLCGSTSDTALVAWANVDRGIRTVGTYDSVVFSDPIIHRVLSDMGGWVLIGTKTEEDWPFLAKEFQNRYRGYSSRGERPEYPPVMIGMAESQNKQMGFKVQSPRLIGDPQRCRQVYLGGMVSHASVHRLDDSFAHAAAMLIDNASESSRDAA